MLPKRKCHWEFFGKKQIERCFSIEFGFFFVFVLFCSVLLYVALQGTSKKGGTGPASHLLRERRYKALNPRLNGPKSQALTLSQPLVAPYNVLKPYIVHSGV